MAADGRKTVSHASSQIVPTKVCVSGRLPWYICPSLNVQKSITQKFTTTDLSGSGDLRLHWLQVCQAGKKGCGCVQTVVISWDNCLFAVFRNHCNTLILLENKKYKTLKDKQGNTGAESGCFIIRLYVDDIPLYHPRALTMVVPVVPENTLPLE